MPVGANTSVERPARISGHAWAWGGVGAGNVVSNQWATAGWKPARAPSTDDVTVGAESAVVLRIPSIGSARP